MAAVTSIVLGTLAVAGAAASYTQQRKAAKSQARAQRAQQRQADIANARERRNAVRAARVARASVENQGAMTGIGVSSTVAASQASISQQLGENVSFLDRMQALSEEASVANQQAANYASRASGYSQLGGMAQSMIGYFGTGDTSRTGGRGGVGPVQKEKLDTTGLWG